MFFSMFTRPGSHFFPFFPVKSRCLQADGEGLNAVRAAGARRAEGGSGRRRVAPGGGSANAGGGTGDGAGHESVAWCEQNITHEKRHVM